MNQHVAHVFLKQLLFYAAALLVAAGMLAGCALPSPVPTEDGSIGEEGVIVSSETDIPAGSNYVIDLTDMAGNPVQLNAYASRIVVLDPADCEILVAIGALDQIVARSEDCDYPDSIAAVPYVTYNGVVDTNLIFLQNPQVVILSGENAEDENLLVTLRDAGITPVVTNQTDINGVYTAITLLGALSDRVAEAGSLTANLITALAEVESMISEHSETVYVELTPLESGLTTDGSGTFLNSLLNEVGFRNEFEDEEGAVSVLPEQVIGRKPDYIITVTPAVAAEGASEEESTPAALAQAAVDEVLARQGWENITAVVKNRVYYIDATLLTRPGPRLIDGVYALYRALYEGESALPEGN